MIVIPDMNSVKRINSVDKSIEHVKADTYLFFAF